MLAHLKRTLKLYSNPQFQWQTGNPRVCRRESRPTATTTCMFPFFPVSGSFTILQSELHHHSCLKEHFMGPQTRYELCFIKDPFPCFLTKLKLYGYVYGKRCRYCELETLKDTSRALNKLLIDCLKVCDWVYGKQPWLCAEIFFFWGSSLDGEQHARSGEKLL